MPTEQDAKALELEAQAREKISVSLSKIEVALAEWESSQEKPEDTQEKIEYLRRAQMLLSGWMQSSLLGPKDGISALRRLARFADICVTLNNEGMV